MDSWIDSYWEPDEIIFRRLRQLNPAALDCWCSAARTLARSFSPSPQPKAASRITGRMGIKVREGKWSVADGRCLYLAECLFDPPVITINTMGICELKAAFRELSCENLYEWTSEESITETVIAHELYHIATGRCSRPSAELAAHCFARALLDLPFSPLLHMEILRRRIHVASPCGHLQWR